MVPLISRRGIDIISQLPDHLLHQILLQLPTKDSVKTSVLSTRWSYLWKHVPGLDLSFYDLRHHNPQEFVDRFLGFDEKSCIRQFKLHLHNGKRLDDTSYFKEWMNIVATRGLQYLVINDSDVTFGWVIELPASFCMCETLVHLKLVATYFESLSLDSVSLPCLETMHLYKVWFPDDEFLERLISSCPVLQGLIIEGIRNVGVIRVRSPTLKSLNLKLINYYDRGYNCGLFIDTPMLKDLCLQRDQFATLVLNNVDTPMRIDLDLEIEGHIHVNDKSKIEEDWRKFLFGISKVVKDLTISSRTLEVIKYDYYSRLGPLPEFPNLTRLCVSFGFLLSSFSEMFVATLSNCPSLKSLYLYDDGYRVLEEITRLHVPKCLLPSLEVVEITSPIEKDTRHTELVEFFLGNAAILEKLVLSLCLYSAEEKSLLLNQLTLFPRRSLACQIYIM